MDARIEMDERTNGCALCLGIAFCPCTILFSWFQVREQQEGVETTPGIHFRNCWGRSIHYVSKQKQSIMLPPTKISDRSGIVSFYFCDSRKTALEIQEPELFVLNNAHTSMRSVVGRYPYESEKVGQLCLKKSSKTISGELTRALQDAVSDAGVKVLSFDFNELSYAPEIAHGMLKRQQAQAMVAARTKIVAGATDIALDAVNALGQRGIDIKPSDRSKIVTNLLTMISSESEAQPVIDVHTKGPGGHY